MGLACAVAKMYRFLQATIWIVIVLVCILPFPQRALNSLYSRSRDLFVSHEEQAICSTSLSYIPKWKQRLNTGQESC